MSGNITKTKTDLLKILSYAVKNQLNKIKIKWKEKV